MTSKEQPDAYSCRERDDGEGHEHQPRRHSVCVPSEEKSEAKGNKQDDRGPRPPNDGADSGESHHRRGERRQKQEESAHLTRLPLEYTDEEDCEQQGGNPKREHYGCKTTENSLHQRGNKSWGDH